MVCVEGGGRIIVDDGTPRYIGRDHLPLKIGFIKSKTIVDKKFTRYIFYCSKILNFFF